MMGALTSTIVTKGSTELLENIIYLRDSLYTSFSVSFLLERKKEREGGKKNMSFFFLYTGYGYRHPPPPPLFHRYNPPVLYTYPPLFENR
jgi:hypothetical protein